MLLNQLHSLPVRYVHRLAGVAGTERVNEQARSPPSLCGYTLTLPTSILGTVGSLTNVFS